MQEQSNKQFYISDWHYGHANVIAFDNRPFKSLLEMDEALVDRWNAVVSPGDIVYVLGDMFWCKAQDAINECKNHHGFVGTDHCPVCGEPVFDTYQRIVGYLVPSRAYSKDRFREFNTRQWYSYAEAMSE